ncbi:transposase [hydrocarbon metagenome]|uniref:Transposase n=1 Tax=hydrocarbon metagenome TaxID=938273 RepID=A0A0W8FDH2_9ZZZZ
MDPLAFIEDYLSDDRTGLLNLITWFLNQVLLQEALQQAGAGHYERTDARKVHRNGYKERSLKTRYGETILKKPQFREVPFETQVFGRYARVEKALVNAIVESYLQGVSTRNVQEIIAHLGIEQLSPASVSRIARDLDEQVQAFLQRPIEQEIPYLFVDASYYKVRDGVQYVAKAALVVAGIREDGYREILGVRITACENEEFWAGMFEDLQARGLTGVQLVISDGHTGIQKAAETAFLGASWQMCQVHCTRAVLRSIPKKYQNEVSCALREAYGDEQRLQAIADDLHARGYRKAANTRWRRNDQPRKQGSAILQKN